MRTTRQPADSFEVAPHSTHCKRAIATRSILTPERSGLPLAERRRPSPAGHGLWVQSASCGYTGLARADRFVPFSANRQSAAQAGAQEDLPGLKPR